VEPWIAPLAAGQPEAAWDLLITRYRRLILAAARRYTTDPDDVMDVFARVCERLRDNDFRRLRHYVQQSDPGRRFSTWLCAVVHNIAIDWIRERHGRQRPTAGAAALPPLQRLIFQHVFIEQRSHVETFELLRSRESPTLSFSEFLRELRATYQFSEGERRGGGRMVEELVAEIPEAEAAMMDADPSILREREAVLDGALRSLPDEDRVAVQLYVIEGMPADQVARALGHQNAKAVYNRVYRALAALRKRLEGAGIAADDL
jgi:RNA polymerase sigma factor (sigma-70 family)